MGDSSAGDPVGEQFGDEDLYDVAEWDQRSLLDTLAVKTHGAVRWGGKGLLILTALLLLVAQVGVIGYAIYRNPAIGGLTLLSVVPALGLAGFVWYHDETMREPWWPLAVTFILAILFASFAATVNTALSPLFDGIEFGMVLFFFLVVGPGEEFVKWLAIRVYAFDRSAFNAVIDGAVYGAVAGLGFATVENALYIVQGVIRANALTGPGTVEAGFQTAYARAFVGPGHVIYSAFAGYYLGLAKFNPEDAGPIVVKGLLIAAAIHATYNSIVTYVSFPGITFLLFILVYDGVFGYILYRKLSRYNSYYTRVTDEDDEPTVEPAITRIDDV
ncbi:PrsW family intramembrane metalloprotease [Halosegnis longus]|uniref:Protease PrsW n=1 Tax=Halosegnis longus TaxID=2216012 RepID=A0AAJ4R7U7_9EURY|nr:protease PrsW [Salella cibi]